MTISEWYRAKRFAEGKAEGRAEDIKALKDRGHQAAAAALEALAQEQDTPREPPAQDRWKGSA